MKAIWLVAGLATGTWGITAQGQSAPTPVPPAVQVPTSEGGRDEAIERASGSMPMQTDPGTGGAGTDPSPAASPGTMSSDLDSQAPAAQVPSTTAPATPPAELPPASEIPSSSAPPTTPRGVAETPDNSLYPSQMPPPTEVNGKSTIVVEPNDKSQAAHDAYNPPVKGSQSLRQQQREEKKALEEQQQGTGGSGGSPSGGSASKALSPLPPVMVFAGGGVEGYSGDLASQVRPGVGWSVTAAFKPTRVLGIELNYSGAANEANEDLHGDLSSGADIVRNGGSAMATVGLPRAAPGFQPFVLAGFGINRYTVRGTGVGDGVSTGYLRSTANGINAIGGGGFQSDTNFSVPIGIGIRSQIGVFTADARVNYNFDFSDGFAPQAASVGGGVTTGRYQGLIQLGAGF